MNKLGKLFKEKKKIDDIFYEYKFDDSTEGLNAMITLLEPSKSNPEKYQINYDHI